MFRDLKPYPECEHTAAGLRPAHWVARSMGSVLRQKSERNRPDLPLLSVARERGVFVRSAGDENHNVVPDDLTNYKVARRGDLVVNKMKAWQGSMGVAPTDGVVSPAYYVYDLALENAGYAHLLLRSKPYVAHYVAASDGVRIGQWDLSDARFRRIPLSIPPVDEQEAIVTYLAHAHLRINQAIATKRQLIALLGEQRRAVLQKILTQGIDQAAPLRDSGIEYLGSVPAHWAVERLGWHVDLLPGYPFESAGFSGDPSQIRLLRGVNVGVQNVGWAETVFWPAEGLDGLEVYALRTGDLVLGLDRPIIRDGIRVCRVTEADVPSALVQRVARLRAKHSIDSTYVQYLLSGGSFARYLAPIFTGISVPHLSPKQVRDFRVPVPPVEEQKRIVEHLASATSAIDAEIRVAHEQTELLAEFRTRLTADVVIGRLDVRTAAARLPKIDPAVVFATSTDGTSDDDEESFEGDEQGGLEHVADE